MSFLSRRQLITGGLATAASASGIAVAARLASRYGLIPPDHGGIYAPGETLTYAAQRILTRHSMAREFPRSLISKTPFANGKPLQQENYLRSQAAGFADWRLQVDGMVDGAFIVRWIGLHFFFSFELSYLRVPEEPGLAGVPEAGNRLSQTSCCSHSHWAEWSFGVLSDSPRHHIGTGRD